MIICVITEKINKEWWGELKIPFLACSFLQEDLIFLSPLVVWFSGLNFAHVSLGFSGLKKTPCLFSLFLASQDL